MSGAYRPEASIHTWRCRPPVRRPPPRRGLRPACRRKRRPLSPAVRPAWKCSRVSPRSGRALRSLQAGFSDGRSKPIVPGRASRRPRCPAPANCATTRPNSPWRASSPYSSFRRARRVHWGRRSRWLPKGRTCRANRSYGDRNRFRGRSKRPVRCIWPAGGAAPGDKRDRRA